MLTIKPLASRGTTLMHRHYYVILTLFSILLFCAVASARESHEIYGSAKVNGVPVPDGTSISVKINNYAYETYTSNGMYGVDNHFIITDEQGDNQGKIMEIYLGGKPAINLIYVNGERTQTNLSVEATCGERICLGTSNSCTYECPSNEKKITGRIIGNLEKEPMITAIVLLVLLVTVILILFISRKTQN